MCSQVKLNAEFKARNITDNSTDLSLGAAAIDECSILWLLE